MTAVAAAEVAPSVHQWTVLSAVQLGQDKLTLHSESQTMRQVSILTTTQPVIHRAQYNISTRLMLVFYQLSTDNYALKVI